MVKALCFCAKFSISKYANFFYFANWRNRKLLFSTLFYLVFIVSNWLLPTLTEASIYQASINPLPLAIQKQMQRTSWHPGCPLALQDLAYLNLIYWGFDNKSHQGTLIINKQLATEVVNIFAQLYQAKFPIQRMQPMYLYNGDDNKSMAANNTSAFNCRLVTNSKSIFSQHSYGTAIDINPLLNPYVNKELILPAAGKQYLNRNINLSGIITPSTLVYKLFTKNGWSWGGSWQHLKDYQHFEKSILKK